MSSPVSFAFSPPEPRASEEIAFGASGSKDPDGKIVGYLWDFAGDGKMDAKGVEATCTFPKAGTYIVTLTMVKVLWGGYHASSSDTLPGTLPLALIE